MTTKEQKRQARVTETWTYRAADFPPGMVAIPCVDWMYTDPVIAFVKLFQALPPGSVYEFGRQSSSPAANRNRLTETFLANPKLEWILFCDSDQTPPPVTVLRLLSHGVDIVAGLIVARQPPYQPGFSGAADGFVPQSGLHEVPWVGSGCVLVRRRVIEAIPSPRWEHPVPGVAEDILFFRKAQAHGFRLYVDCSLNIGHMATRAVTVQDAAEFQVRPEGQAMLAHGLYIDPDLDRELAAATARIKGNRA